MTKKLVFITLAGCLILSWATMAVAGLGPHTQATWATQGDCAVCHNVSQTAKLRGWGLDITGFPSSAWLDNRPISKLCWSCHRFGGTKDPAKDMYDYAFHDSSHSYDEATAPYPPEPIPAGQETFDPIAQGLPYLSAANTDLLECTSCHNVHVYENRPFRMKGAAGNDFSPLCKACHQNRDNAGNVGTANTHLTSTYSVHPTDVAMTDIPNNGLSNILTVAAMDVRLKAPIISDYSVDAWELGGKLADGETGNLSCGTCHRVHGDEQENLLFNNVLLSIQSYEVDHSPLCVGCHGLPVGNDATTNMTDHPLHGQLPNRTFYPSSFITVDGIPDNWESSAALPTAGTRIGYGATIINTLVPENLNAGSDPSCSSCHDVHGGVGGTSLWYAPDNQDGIDHWCFNCHPRSAVIPSYHHSNIWNDDDFTANPLCTVSPPASVLDCGHCHGVTLGGYWRAHNGFWDFLNNVAISDTDSAICEECHTPTDPTLLIPQGYDAASAGWPARHAPDNLGADSHLVGVTFGINNVVSFSGDWIGQADGSYAAPYDRLPTDAAFPAGVFSEWGAGGEVLCESCHDLLENCGPETGDPLGGGWKMNLLYLAYEDDNFGNLAGAEEICSWDTAQTGDRFCRICHNLDTNDPPDGIGNGIGVVGTGTYVHYPGAHTVETFFYAPDPNPYGRPTGGIMTTPNDPTTTPPCPDVSTADNLTAPNNFSYPADNQIDCDSCHRAHNAHTADAAVGGGVTSHVIMQDAAALPKTDACFSCHNDQIMCGQ